MNGISDIAREERLGAARQRAYATPLSEFHPDDPERFQTDTLSPYFERLRNEQPVHLCSTSPVGAYWSASTRKSQHQRRGTRDEV